MPTLDSRPVAARMPGPRAPRMEHRFGHRHPCGTRVRMSAGDGITGGGRLLNVSLSGAYVQTALDLPLFGIVAIEKIHEGSDGVELLAMVVRKDPDGAGVEWCETPGCSICQALGCAQPCYSASDD
jgi:hypothetical protein